MKEVRLESTIPLAMVVLSSCMFWDLTHMVHIHMVHMVHMSAVERCRTLSVSAIVMLS